MSKNWKLNLNDLILNLKRDHTIDQCFSTFFYMRNPLGPQKMSRNPLHNQNFVAEPLYLNELLLNSKNPQFVSFLHDVMSLLQSFQMKSTNKCEKNNWKYLNFVEFTGNPWGMPTEPQGSAEPRLRNTDLPSLAIKLIR